MRNFEPLFIVGFPRSGTTLLLHMIRASNAYPNYDFDETHYFSHYYLRYGDLSKSSQRRNLITDVIASDWFEKSGLNKCEFIDAIKAEEVTYHGVLAKFMELIAAKQGKMRWLEKTPWHMLYIDEIAESYPSAKFVFVVRDPRSVVQSVYKAGWSKGVTKGQLRIAVAWRWYNMLADSKFQTIPKRYICVTYEDLILNSQDVERRLSCFLGIKIDINSMPAAKLSALGKSNSSFGDNIEGLSQAPLSRWKNNMDTRIMASIEYLAGEKCMGKYGYEKFSVDAPSFVHRINLRQLLMLYYCLKSLRMMLFPMVRR